MAELEIHTHEGEHASDPAGRRVGIQAAILAVLLAVVTILSHRTHTAAIIHKSTSNDQWAYYQATRIKLHSSELGISLIRSLGVKSDAAEKAVADYQKQSAKYEEQSKANQEKAEAMDQASEADERRALRYDIGEGLLEIGLVLSSMFFVARKDMFPVLGILAGVGGIVSAALGLLV